MLILTPIGLLCIQTAIQKYNFGVEHIPKEIKKFIGNKSITTNIFRIHAILDNANLFSPNNFKDNYKIILNYIKMDEATNMYPNSIDQTQFRLSRINKIKDYSIAEIRKIESLSKGINCFL